MSYIHIPLTEELSISSLVTIHYFEYMKDFVYDGETHDFWEFVCVDCGDVEVYDGKQWHLLNRGNIFFHMPMEFHALRATGNSAPRLIVISFDCKSPAMTFFEHRLITYTEYQRELLSKIIAEAGFTFSSPLNDPYLTEMKLNENTGFAALQMIKLLLQTFLIDIVRKNSPGSFPAAPASPAGFSVSTQRRRSDEALAACILAYFNDNLTRQLNVKQICSDNYISYSRLKQVFHQSFGCGVLEYFNKLRITRAKELIREGNLNISEVSSCLGYSSIHYFSRQFRNSTGMSPSEYAHSIKALAERSESL